MGVVFFPGYFTTPSPPFLRGILYAIYRITHLNKMKIPIQLNYVKQDLMQNQKNLLQLHMKMKSLENL